MSNPGEEGILKALSILCSFGNRGTERTVSFGICAHFFFAKRVCRWLWRECYCIHTTFFFFFLPTWSFKPTQMSPSKNINIPGLSHRASPTMGDQEGINDPKLCYSKAHWLHTLPQVKGHHCLSLRGQINKGNTAVTLVLKFTRHIREAKWFCRRKIFYLILFSS